MSSKLTDEQYSDLLKGKNYSILGSYFWACFSLLEKGNNNRTSAEKRWDALTKEQQKAIEASE